MMRTIQIFCIVLTVACSGSLSAQKLPQYFVDSLFVELTKSKSDKEKLDIYIELIDVYNDLDGVKGLQYEEPALSLARKLGSVKGEGLVNNVVGRIYWRQGNFDRAVEYHNAALDLFKKLKDQQLIAVTLKNLGQDCLLIRDHDKAREYFEEALKIYRTLKDFDRQGFIYNLLSWTYADMGDYGESSRYCYLGLEVFEESGNEIGVAHMNAGIAENSLFLGNYQDALDKLLRATEIFRKNDDMINVGATLNILGRVYMLMRNYDAANEQHRQALDIGHITTNMQMIGTAFSGLGDVAMETKNTREAVNFFLFAAQNYKEWRNMAELAKTYRKLSTAYRALGNYDSARYFIDQAMPQSLILGNRSEISTSYHEAELLDSTLGHWENAYKNHQLYITYRDSVFSQYTTKDIVLLQKQYEFDKTQEVALAEQQRKESQKQTQIIFLVIIIGLILALVFLQYRGSRALTRLNRDLTKKSERLETEMAEKSGILHVVTHDLKSPLNKVRGLTNLLEMSLSESDHEQKELIQFMRTSVDQGDHLIKNLLDSEITSQSEEPKFEAINLFEFLTEYQASINAQLALKDQKLIVETSLAKTLYKIEKQLLSRVFDNLIGNASKFSSPGKPVFMTVADDGEKLAITIRDEGPGISEGDQKQMFRKFQMLTAKPTGGEPSAGLGLSIVKSIVERLNGSITVKSQLGVGTEFLVHLPMVS